MTPVRPASPWNLAALLFALGFVGVLTLLNMPLPAERSPGVDVGVDFLHVLLLVNPSILLLVAVAVGTPAAFAIGLGAPILSAMLERRDWRAAVRQVAPAALLVAIVTAVVLLGYATFVMTLDLIPLDVAAQPGPPLIVRLLYGGITEEVMLRWGVMTGLAWLFARALPRTAAIWLANIAAALLFAALHLPYLYSLVPEAKPILVGAAMIGNAGPGILFGWLFWKRGIEAAMLAHAGGHFIAWAVGLALA